MLTRVLHITRHVRKINYDHCLGGVHHIEIRHIYTQLNHKIK